MNDLFNLKDLGFEEIAEKCMKQTKNRIYLKYRALSPAIYRMPVEYVQAGNGQFGTDAQKIYADPMNVVLVYRKSPDELERMYIHMLFHCIFLHPFITKAQVEEDLWNLSMDICCESAVLRLEPKDFDNRDDTRRNIISVISGKVQMMLPELVYREMRSGDYDLMALTDLFHMDNHLWMVRNQFRDNHCKEDNSSSELSETGQRTCGDASNSQIKQEWSTVSRKIAADIQSFHSQGSDPGSTVNEIEYLIKDKMEYGEFLRQFAVIEEKMQVNMDEFDYMFYIYGLSLPGQKKLLIEPLEYKEKKVVKEFVIAIDTSGSCSGELVQRFLRKTYSILKETESFSNRVNIHIIQCDAKVQQDIKITNKDEMEEYMQNMRLFGFGGTDFRPVFEYVDTLIKNKEFENLSGLLYFTDGYVTYPRKPTPYKTAFVFLEDYENRKDIPSWAMSVFWKDDLL